MDVSSKSPAPPDGVKTGDASGGAGAVEGEGPMPDGRGARTFAGRAVSSLSERHGHSRCIMCGESNPWSLRLAFEPDGQGGVSAPFTGHPGLQGYRGILHGGVTAALLDSAMTHCLFHHGVEAFTADLHVRYLHAIACCACLEIKGVLVSSRAPLYRMRAEILQGGDVMAWGEAKFLVRKGEAQWPKA